MDILWAISHSQLAPTGTLLPFPGAAAATGTFAVPTPPYADGSWDMYQDFVGSVQFWGYGLVSGSGDGAVRMWDSEYLVQSCCHKRNNDSQCVLARLIAPCSDTQDP